MLKMSEMVNAGMRKQIQVCFSTLKIAQRGLLLGELPESIDHANIC